MSGRPLSVVKVSWRQAKYKAALYYFQMLIILSDAHIIVNHSKSSSARRIHLEDTAGARIIERSQEYKSTVKYRTFVLLRVPIPRGVGKFNYRTGIRSIIKFPHSIIKFPRSIK